MAKNDLSRRDFLKLFSLIPPVYFHSQVEDSKLLHNFSEEKNNNAKVIIIVLDTLSANHLSLFGYKRETSQNLERFAKRSNVYHNHYSTGNFTIPGTASLLTGLYPWTHRANNYAAKILDSKSFHNIFRLLGEDVFRISFSQNPHADLLLQNFSDSIDHYIKFGKFNLNSNSMFDKIFLNDAYVAYQGVEGFSLRQDSGLPSAQIISAFNNFRAKILRKQFNEQYRYLYPLGVPYLLNDIGEPFTLDDLFSGVQRTISKIPKTIPSLTYIHLYPPHGPYLPTREFVDIFNDNWLPHDKPVGVFPETISRGDNIKRLQKYDEYIAATDHYFGKLLDYMNSEDIIKNNYVVLTSDHGELFERGIHGHTNEYLYEPIIKVPLIISTPGQTQPVDIYTPTSSVDLTPTILSFFGKEIPDSMEGKILPGFSEVSDEDRSIYSFVSKSTPRIGKFGAFTISLRKRKFKLIFYSGYDNIPDTFELYDLENDPNELENLYNPTDLISKQMKQALLAKLGKINS